jgi:hypothetical protein
VHATTALDPHWLHLYQRPLEYDGQSLSDLVEHGIRWSTTGPSSGFTTVNGIDFSFSVGWCGFYARTWDGAIASDLDVKFDDAALLFPHGRRSCRFYALRDPDIPGNYDLAGASAVLKRMKQAHTHAAAITSLAFLAGDPESLCGRGPCGEGEGTAAGWTIDAGAGLGTPETASEWDAVLEDAGIASGGPVSIYPMQDAAGDLVDANAVEDLAALGVAATYLDAVPGWTRKGVTFADGIATRFEATIGAGDTESFLFVLYVRVTGVPAAIRSIVEHPNVYAEISTVPRIRANGGSVVTGAVDPGTDVHMIVVQSDRAASVLRVITEDEVLEPVDIEVATTTMVLGGTAASPGMTTLLGARFTGAAAELSRAEIKALYETLGWTVAWVP